MQNREGERKIERIANVIGRHYLFYNALRCRRKGRNNYKGLFAPSLPAIFALSIDSEKYSYVEIIFLRNTETIARRDGTIIDIVIEKLKIKPVAVAQKVRPLESPQKWL